jgi:hypothetical protein
MDSKQVVFGCESFGKIMLFFNFGLMNKKLDIKFTQGFYGNLSIVFVWWC